MSDKPPRRGSDLLVPGGILTLLTILTLSEEALARVGGGEGFSTGSSRSSGSNGGGGGGGEADLLFLLIRLCIYYPQIGVPLLIVFVGWLWWQHSQGGRPGRRREVIAGHPTDRRTDLGVREAVSHREDREGSRSSRPADQLRALDPAFSEPVLYDLLQLVYRRAWQARTEEDWQALAPFLKPEVRQQLSAARGAAAIDDVVIASVGLTRLDHDATWTRLRVRFTSSRTVDARRRQYQEESWTFRRAAGARSLAPDAVHRLGCPSCGAAVQCDPMGRCKNCGTPITEGQLQWQAEAVQVQLTRELGPPEVRPHDGRRDPSLDLPTRLDPFLAPSMRAFTGRHPNFDSTAWERRVHHVFHSLQQAWSEGRWEQARPFVTDAAWNTLRFWLDRYARAGLRNRIADVKILKMQAVKVTLDPWYEAVTLRFWAELRDWVEEVESGKVVGGDKGTARPFSEYWTFIRAVGTGDTSGDPEHCPSCGAPLDKVNAAGVCGYCDSVITTGRFDWVLSRIDQAEVYEG